MLSIITNQNILIFNINGKNGFIKLALLQISLNTSVRHNNLQLSSVMSTKLSEKNQIPQCSIISFFPIISFVC